MQSELCLHRASTHTLRCVCAYCTYTPWQCRTCVATQCSSVVTNTAAGSSSRSLRWPVTLRRVLSLKRLVLLLASVSSLSLQNSMHTILYCTVPCCATLDRSIHDVLYTADSRQNLLLQPVVNISMVLVCSKFSKTLLSRMQTLAVTV
jgi:hypothetical protein